MNKFRPNEFRLPFLALLLTVTWMSVVAQNSALNQRISVRNAEVSIDEAQISTKVAPPSGFILPPSPAPEPMPSIDKLVPAEYRKHPEYGIAHPDLPESIELIHKRDQNSRTYQNSAHSYSKIQSYGAMHYQDANGFWLTIDSLATRNFNERSIGIVKSDLPVSWKYDEDILDLRLAKNRSVTFSQPKLLFAKYSANRTEDFPAEDQFVNLFSNGYAYIEERSSSTNGMSFTQVGNLVEIKDYFPGIDKSMTIDYWGTKSLFKIKERLPEFDSIAVLVIEERMKLPSGWTAVNTFSENVDAELPEDVNLGDIIILDEMGVYAGKIHVPTFYDHSVKSENEQAFVTPYAIIPTGEGQYVLRYGIPTSYLNDESRNYPIIIDPSVSNTYGSYISTYYGSENSGCQAFMNVNVGGTTVNVTNTYTSFRMYARNGAWLSEQRGRVYGPAGNFFWQGPAINNGGNMFYDGNGGVANGNRVGNIGFTLRAYRTWGLSYSYQYVCGTYCCNNTFFGCAGYCDQYCTATVTEYCGQYYQYINPDWYVRVDYCDIPQGGTMSANATSVCAGTPITITNNTWSAGTVYYWASTQGGYPCAWDVYSQAFGGNSSFAYTYPANGNTSSCESNPWRIEVYCASYNSCYGWNWGTGHTIYLDVYEPPSAPTSISGNTSICSGQSTTLTLQGGSNGAGATYQWFAGGCGSGAVIGTGTSITVSPTVSTTYYVRRVGNTACTAATGCASVLVNVGATNPNPTSITGTNNICQGQSTTLSINGGHNAYYTFTGNYNDSGPLGLHLNSGSGGFITGNSWQMAVGGSRTSATTNILNTDKYTIEFDMMYTSPQDGNWRKIFGYNAGGDRSPGIWKFPNSMQLHWRHNPGNTGINEAYTYNINQWYHIVGEKDGATFRLFVDGVLVASGAVANPKSAGDVPLWFGGAPVRIDNWKIYSGVIRWYGNGACSGAVVGYGPQITVTPASTTTYSARIEGECNNTSCVSRTVTVNIAPTAFAGLDRSQCSTTAYTITDASITGSGSLNNWTYVVNTGTATVSGTGTLTPTITPTSGSGQVTMTLNVNGTNGCPGTSDVMVMTWSTGASANAGPDVNQCGNTNVPFSGSSASSPSTFTWTLLGGGSGTGNIVAFQNGGANPTDWRFEPTSTSGSRTIRLSVTGTGPCAGSTVTDDIVITWSAPPTVSTTSPINSCNGDAAISITGATASGTYSGLSWSLIQNSGAGSITSGGTTLTPVFTPTTDSLSGQYILTLQATGSGQCVGVNPTASVTVNWDEPPTANAGSDFSVCEGNSATLSGSSVSGGAYSNVTWTIVGGTASGGTFTSTSSTDPTAWTITTTSSGYLDLQLDATGSGTVCGTTHSYDVVRVTWDPLPVANAGSDILNSCTGTSTIPMTGSSASGTYGSVSWSIFSGSGATVNSGTTNPATWSITPSVPANYIVMQLTVSGSGTCAGSSDTDQRIVDWGTNPVIDVVYAANVTDCNNDNGAISVSATGYGPLEYSNDNGSTWQSLNVFSGLSDGVNYNIVVRDTNTCSITYASNPVTISGPPPVTFSTTVLSGNSCAGLSTGSFEISNIQNGQATYQYTLEGSGGSRWVDIGTYPDTVYSLAAGTYPVVIRDAFGCESAVTNVTINEPSPITFSSINVTDIVGCGGSGSGAINAVATGGTGSLDYYLNQVINTPSTSGSWNGLVGGSYQVGVIDANNCFTSAEVAINAPWTIDVGNDAFVCGATSATLDAEIVGDLPTDCTPICTSGCGIPGACAAQGTNLSDDWIGRVTFNTINNTTGSTTYSNFTGLSTTVNRGSSYTLTVVVNKNAGWNQCVRAYFDWNRDGVFGAGEMYDLGCSTANPQTTSLPITIPAGASLGNTRMRIYETYAGAPPANGCGTLTYSEVEDYTVTVVGVNTPCVPTYSWSPTGGSNLSATVNPGTSTTYTLTVNDGAGCVQSANVDVVVSGMAASDLVTDVNCNGDDDGCITVTSSGGVAPYLYKLGSEVKIFDGRYKPITIANSNGTLTNHPVKISGILFSAPMLADFANIRFVDANMNQLSYWIESYTLSTSADVWVKIPSLPNGNSTIYLVYGNSSLSSASNGENVFEFFDDFNSFDNTKWTKGLIASTTGTDWSFYGGSLNGGNTCRTFTSIPTFSGSKITEARTYESASAPNGFTSAGFWSTTGNGLTILNHNGTNYARNDGGWPNFGGAGAGQRNVWIREYVRANGASSFVSRTIESGGIYSATYSNSGLSSERLRLGARGDNWIPATNGQNFSASWDWMFVRPYVAVEPTVTIGAEVLPDNQFCSLAPGSYSLVSVDMGGCSQTINFTITEPSPLVIDGIDVTNTWCYNNAQGALDITVSGGTPAYVYNWAGPASYSSNVEDPTGLAAGLYNVTVADDNACTASSSATVGTATPITAPSFTWTGMTDQLWQDPTNWDCGVPDATSDVIIPASPIGGNTPLITGGVIGDVFHIRVMGNIADLLKIDSDSGSKLRVWEP